MGPVHHEHTKVEVQLQAFLNSVLVGSEQSISRPGCSTCKGSLTNILFVVGQARELVWTLQIRQVHHTSAGKAITVVSSAYNDRAPPNPLQAYMRHYMLPDSQCIFFSSNKACVKLGASLTSSTSVTNHGTLNIPTVIF
jgi:hypothetical protein